MCSERRGGRARTHAHGGGGHELPVCTFQKIKVLRRGHNPITPQRSCAEAGSQSEEEEEEERKEHAEGEPGKGGMAARKEEG